MTLLITDANVFIDLEEGELLAHLFGIGRRIATPDLLFHDELSDAHGHLVALGLELLVLAPETLLRVQALAARHRRPGRLDLAALAAAEQERCPLVTGDAALRDAASAEGVEVVGTLWVCAEMVRHGTLTVDDLRVAYAAMRRAGRRLPWAEVEAQLRALGRGRA
ncbi:MAG: DUF3368 domain-containing protein [Deltaproteobacteria bacterium]|nr:MAG: DUF3368 domain-containing protein [Deltaproteobacteria bacterium]